METSAYSILAVIGMVIVIFAYVGVLIASIFIILIIAAYSTTFITFFIFGKGIELSIMDVLNLPYSEVSTIALSNIFLYCVIVLFYLCVVYSCISTSKKSD